MANRRGKSGSRDRFYFLGLQNHSGDYSREIKRCLLFGRKAMTNLDSILKSRDITFLTQVHIVKAMVFPVVMYVRETIKTIKKAERRRIDAFELCWRRLLRVPWTTKRSNQSVLKEINRQQSLEGLMLTWKLQYLTSDEKRWLIGKDPDARKDWMRKEKAAGEDEISDGITD